MGHVKSQDGLSSSYTYIYIYSIYIYNILYYSYPTSIYSYPIFTHMKSHEYHPSHHPKKKQKTRYQLQLSCAQTLRSTTLKCSNRLHVVWSVRPGQLNQSMVETFELELTDLKWMLINLINMIYVKII